MAETDNTQHLQRRLSERQIAMIAIGGAIGVGLFLGSNVTISLAGPGVILTYVLGAVLSLIVAYSLAEMAVVHPVAGSFGIYAERYLDPWSGFTVRVTYALIQIIAIGAEVTAVAIYFQYWLPNTPQWIWVVAVSIGLVTINAAQVNKFGELEYWLSFVKVTAIVVFIVIGIFLIAGLAGRPALGLRNLTAYGGFLPHGYAGVWLALTLVISSYMGVEIVAVTAGETQRPFEAIPRAMRTIVLRLILFYVLAIAVMVTVSSWHKSGDGTLSGSPFVSVFAIVGIPYAATVMNLVVIAAALSSANTNLYTSTRMLYSLARGNYAPATLGRLSRHGVPQSALAICSLGMAAAILLAIYAPKHAFLVLYGSAVAGMYFVWIIILLAHMRFRRSIGPAVDDLPLRLWLFPISNVVGVATLIALAFSTFYVDGLQYSVPTLAVFLAGISVVYTIVRRRMKSEPSPHLEAAPESPQAEP